jgi:hypothetical protein
MGFFVRASVEALKRYPVVNASIDGNDVVYHGYQDIGVAVSSERGLVVPVLRDADTMSIADVEQKIREYGIKAKDGSFIEADLRVWAAGVKGADFLKEIAGLETNGNNQLVVKPTLQSTRDERIFALGDCCTYIPEGQTRPIPPRAQAAHQMATTVFRNIRKLIKSQALEDFTYKDHGSLVSLSRYSTVGSLMGNLVGGRMEVAHQGLAGVAQQPLQAVQIVAGDHQVVL